MKFVGSCKDKGNVSLRLLPAFAPVRRASEPYNGDEGLIETKTVHKQQCHVMAIQLPFANEHKAIISREYAKVTTDGIRTHCRKQVSTKMAQLETWTHSHEYVRLPDWTLDCRGWGFSPERDYRDFKALCDRGSLRAWIRTSSVAIFCIPHLFGLWLSYVHKEVNKCIQNRVWA